MKVSVIFTTYNSPEWLKKVFWGFQQQSYQDFEIIVADDGSTEETKKTIQHFQQIMDIPVKHVWHEDQGFQKCRILNKAILEASGEYIVFTDGDCVTRNDFLKTHLDNAEQGYFLTGTYVKLPMETSIAIKEDDVISGRCFTLDWLTKNGYKHSKNNLKLTASGLMSKLLNRITTANANFMGANASAWKSDLLKANGFDERMQYGGLDRELGVRLKNAGIKAKRVRFSAVCLHLDHARAYKKPELVAQNKALRVHNEKNGITSTDFGIKQLES